MSIGTREEIARRVNELRGEGKKIGFTSGVFDLLHAGHVDYLEKARATCDVLVVGVNSDLSVQRNKGPDRPIVTGTDRILVVAGLRSVDYAFLFEERNNNENITLLRPDVYCKASDYGTKTLSSAPIVESYGGRVVLVPLLTGYSSTGLIERIQGAALTSLGQVTNSEPRPAVFVDRDGTICEHIEYLHEPEKFKLIPGALEGLKRFADAGYRIIVVTNQPGIGLGYFSKEAFYRVNRELLIAASRAGLDLDKIYFCPHSKSEHCTCRKPAVGMLERAVAELGVVREESVVIGDMTSDVMLGERFGCKTVLVKTGRGGEDRLFDVSPDIVAESITDAATQILG
jgi:rfaE bifunctional protein nucleotidyltransferase chain/domain